MNKTSKFEQTVRIVNELAVYGESRGLGRLYTEDNYLNGRIVTIDSKPLLNFGSCSYLGLELDPRLKEAAIDAVQRYGSLFSCSRMYMSSGNYKELETLLEKIFDSYILVTSTVSIGHHSVMPIIIGPNDVVIFDQQAHISMQELTYKLSYYGTTIDILRHNRIDDLANKIEKYNPTCEKIWYVIDGVYSMFGDFAPMNEIFKLLDAHPKLNLYVDDAHGMSWAGRNGQGFALSQNSQHQKMILGTTLAKGFGSSGGVFSFKNKEWRDKVKLWGGPLAYSGPQEPATVGAAIASAKIHLSDEISVLQNKLQTLIQYCNTLLFQYKIPLISEDTSPIFFVACGLPVVAFELTERMIKEGFYVNIATFPVVPENCTGVRFTITNHITFEDIEKLAKAFATHLPSSLQLHNRTMMDVSKAFRKFADFEKRFGSTDVVLNKSKNSFSNTKSLQLETYTSIRMIDKKMWNILLGGRGTFCYDNLVMLEEVFSNNNEPECNWEFVYYVVTQNGKPILATFFTTALLKDDMLAPENISQQIEKIRIDDPYYLTSKTILMGTMITNGDHLYVDKTSTNWQAALTMVLDAVWTIQDTNGINTVYLRDFNEDNTELTQFFNDHGFIKLKNLENNCISNIEKHTFESYLNERLNSKKRYQIKNEALIGIQDVILKINDENLDLHLIYKMYKNVKDTNLSLNTHLLPFKYFEKIKESESWEILTLHCKETNSIIAMSLCLRSENSYSHVIYGVEKSNDKYTNPYKMMLYFVVKRAFEIKAATIHMGITANDTKRKFGAEQIKQVAFIQIKDKYNQELIDSMAFNVR